MTDQKLQPADNENNLPIKPGFGANIKPEVVFEKIDKLKAGITEAMPTLLQRLTDPGARTVATELRGLQTDVIKARREMIQGLSDAIEQYVRVHVDQLGQDRAAFLLARFAEYRSNLIHVNDKVILNIFQRLACLREDLNRTQGLTDDEKKQIASRMWSRAERNETVTAETFEKLLDSFAKLVTNTMEEIKNIGKKLRP